MLKRAKNVFWLKEQMDNEQLRNELFYCEHIMDDPQNHELVRKFKVKQKTGYGLEIYLKSSAIKEEKEHVARTYIVKDIVTHEIVAYFSLKAGMIASNDRSFLFSSDFDSIPGIEIANFAVNSMYKEAHSEYEGIGKIIFVDFILPLVRQAAKYIGIAYLYIFSLPYDSLIEHYESFGFGRLSFLEEFFMHRRIRPRYDKRCIFMVQKISYQE